MARVMQLNQSSLQFTLISLDNTKIDMKKAGRAAVDAAGEIALKYSKRAVGLRDHSLTDLANLDHPYAKRHGSIRIHTDIGTWHVHRAPTGGLSGAARSATSKRTKTHRVQTDRMFQATKGRPTTNPQGVPQFEVYFDLAQAPHAEDVVLGTQLMLPRDPLWNAVMDPDVRTEMMKAVVVRMGRVLRSKVGIRFGSGSPSMGGGGTSAR